VPKNVKQTLLGADMDITSYDLPSDKLKERILQDVKDTQLFVGMHLPDKLFITFNQFKQLEDDIQSLDETEFRIYVTPYNAMEVHIVDTPSFVDVEAITGVEMESAEWHDQQ
jgi:hypothetical protein